MKTPHVLAIIPARGGSKGIPRKNMKSLLGKPLIWYSIQAAKQSQFIDTVVVSSDDKEILQFAQSEGVRAIKRPDELATDAAATEPALLHVVEELKKEGDVPDLIVLLQPTSPHRSADDVDGAIQTLLNNNADSLLSVVPNHSFLWQKGPDGMSLVNYDYRKRPRRQDMIPQFRENGSIYVTKTDILVNDKNRLGGKITIFVMDEAKGFEIDSEFDFKLLEFLIQENEK